MFYCNLNNTRQPSCYLWMFKDEENIRSMSCSDSQNKAKYILTLGYTGKKEDNGKQIYCKAIYPSENRTSEERYTIRIAAPPEQPEISGPEAVIWEQLFTWTCDVKGGSIEAPDVRWKFGNNTEITENLYSNTVYENVTAEHEIKTYNVKSSLRLYVPKDQQKFGLTCRYIHNVTRYVTREPEKTTSVTVLCCGPKINCTAPPLLVNDTLSCSCSVTGLPHPAKLTWPGHSDDAQFNIGSVTKEHNGSRFVCNMKFNKVSINSTEYILRVTDGPKINCTAGPLRVKDTLTCSCSATGLSHPAKLTWPGHSDDANFIISSLTVEDNGLRVVCNMKFNKHSINSTEYILTVNSSDDELQSKNETLGASADTGDSSILLMIIIGVLVAVLLMSMVVGGAYLYHKRSKARPSKAAASGPKPTPLSLSSEAGESKKSVQDEQTEHTLSQISEATSEGASEASKMTSETTSENTEASKMSPENTTEASKMTSEIVSENTSN